MEGAHELEPGRVLTESQRGPNSDSPRVGVWDSTVIQ